MPILLLRAQAMNRTLSLHFIAGWLALAAACFACPNSEVQAEQGKPIKVFILSGQSNMVGAGKVTGGSGRWGAEFLDPVLSVYQGDYDSQADYDAMKPTKTLKLKSFGGVRPTPYLGGGAQVVRGYFKPKASGLYEFRPGYQGSTHNIMHVAGQEVHRREVGQESVHKHIQLMAGKKVPFKITYLTKQANGLGWTARMDIPGTLSTVVRHQGKFPYLLNAKGQWSSRDDVWYKGVVTATANKWLSVGCGASSNSIGPELGFGHVVGDHLQEPVLLLKASQGNRSLGWDFLPPGSKQFEREGKIYAGYKDSPDAWEKGTAPKPINWYAGKQYDDCFSAAHQVLDNFDKQFPHWKGRGYEIVGFAWWQGDKDRYNAAHAEKYEENLVRLISNLRSEFKAPKAKFVCATLGQTAKGSATGNEKLILEAQFAVQDKQGKYPQLKGNVRTVYTHPLSLGGASNSHYNGNAETYMNVGRAMGEAMVELLEADKN